MKSIEMVYRRKVKIKTGREGPAYDPYGFTEITIETNMKKVTIHLGLDCYLKVFGQKDKDTEHCTDLVMKAFERHVGCSYDSVVRAFYKLRDRCPHCGSRKGFESYSGYIGETLHVCRNCKAIAYEDFDESAII